MVNQEAIIDHLLHITCINGKWRIFYIYCMVGHFSQIQESLLTSDLMPKIMYKADMPKSNMAII